MEINLFSEFSSHSVSAGDSVSYNVLLLQLTPFLKSTIGITTTARTTSTIPIITTAPATSKNVYTKYHSCIYLYRYNMYEETQSNKKFYYNYNYW